MIEKVSVIRVAGKLIEKVSVNYAEILALLSGNDFEINFGRKTSVFQFYLQLIDISKNQKSISISQR
ncbi:hypothetical protein, partial [Okeania sp. SIO2B9]